MRKLSILLLILLTGFILNGQPISGIRSIPGEFPSIASAADSMNLYGVGPGGVTFLVAAGHVEISSNILLTTNTASESKPIIFRKDGVGANPRIIASAGTSATTDGIVKFAGTDFVTFDRIDLSDTSANGDPVSRMEWGFAILMASDSDASRNITIKGCKITMNREYSVSPFSTGIYSRNHLSGSVAAIVPASESGVVSHCRIDSCIISDVVCGIQWVGAAQPDHYGQDNLIGNSDGNIIFNFGGGNAPAYGIYIAGQNDVGILNNDISGGDGTLSSLYGIFSGTAVNSSIHIRNNTLSLVSAATTSNTYGIYNSAGSQGAGNAIRITGNYIYIQWPTVTSGNLYGIFQSAGSWRCNVDSNSVTGCIQGGLEGIVSTGQFAAIYTFGSNQVSGSHWSIKGNHITGNSKIQTLRGTGVAYGIYNSSSGLSLEISDNQITDNQWSSSSIGAGIFVSNSTAKSILIDNNQIINLSKPGALPNALPRSGSLYGIFAGATANNALVGISANHIENLSNSWGGRIFGIRCDVGSTSSVEIQANQCRLFSADDQAVYGIYGGSGLKFNIFNNKVAGLNAITGDSAAFYGLVTDGSTFDASYDVYNNLISELSAPESQSWTSSGMMIAGNLPGVVHKYYNNTVYLDQQYTTGSGSSAALYASTTAQVDIRNNILVNRANPAGNGIASAYRSTGTDISGHLSFSNFNCLYADTLSPNQLLFYGEDTASPLLATDIGEYRALFQSEGQSFSELPPFINISVTPFDLHLTDSVATSCESGGVAIFEPPVSEDIDLAPRFPNPGYPVHSDPFYPVSAPDVGADEFGGIPLHDCISFGPMNARVFPNGICAGETVVLSLDTIYPGTGISYQWQGSSDGIQYNDLEHQQGAIVQIIPVNPSYYRCRVTCINDSLSVYSEPTQLHFVHQVDSIVNSRRCGAGTLDLLAFGGSGNLKWYAEALGGEVIGSGTVLHTPVLDSTTIYYVAAEEPSTGAVIGNGQYISAGYESPFYHLYGGKKSQYLIRADELTGSGLSDTLTSLAFEVASAGGIYHAFTISIGHTTLNALPMALQTGLLPVYSIASVTPVTGVNQFYLDTPFVWDGSSNLIIETCWSNNNTGGPTATVKYDPVAYTAQAYFRADLADPGLLCSSTSASGTMNSRPRILINYQPECKGPRFPVAAEVVDLIPIQAAADHESICQGDTVILSVTSSDPDYIFQWFPGGLTGPVQSLTPTQTTNYIVSATDTLTGCIVSDSLVVTVFNRPEPIVIVPENPVIYRGDVQRFSVEGLSSGAMVTWSPFTDLFLDSLALEPYLGDSVSTVYARPQEMIFYVATAFFPTVECLQSDSVHVVVLDPCEPPFNIVADSITSFTATLFWNEPSHLPGNGYIYEIRTSGAPGSGPAGLVQSSILATGTDALLLSGLMPATTYHAWLRSDCGDGQYSEWSADCQFTTSILPLEISGDVSEERCSGNCDGAINITVTGGVPPYSFFWSTGAQTEDVDQLCTGNYQVTVTDASLITVSQEWFVPVPPEISATAQHTPVSCHGGSNGTVAVLTTEGGTPPYHYEWSTGDTTLVVNGLPAGDYSLIITDAHLCDIRLFTTIPQPDPISLTIVMNPASCPGASDGSINLTTQGGTPGYHWQWATGDTTESISELSAGLYQVSVSDANFCSVIESIQVGILEQVCRMNHVAGALNTEACYDASDTVIVAGFDTVFEVTYPGRATLIAGQRILMLPGTRVFNGGYLSAKIAPEGPFCVPQKVIMAGSNDDEQSNHSNLKSTFMLYPNPGSGRFFLERRSVEDLEPVNVTIWNMQGVMVMQQTMENPRQEFFLAEHAAGLYLVVVEGFGIREVFRWLNAGF